MNEINKRLKELRLELKYSQQKMGEILGVSKSGVSDIESGRRNVTEQHILMLKNCADFYLNEPWLRTGEGKMFLDVSREEELARFTKQFFKEEDEGYRQRLISAVAKLSEEQLELLANIADTMVKQEQAKKE